MNELGSGMFKDASSLKFVIVFFEYVFPPQNDPVVKNVDLKPSRSSEKISVFEFKGIVSFDPQHFLAT